jgi:hypothetical protein
MSLTCNNCFEAPPGAPVVCFSALDTVQVLERGSVPMKDLNVGDLILVDGARNLYEPIYSFGHHDVSGSAFFINLHTDEVASEPLQVTKEHWVYIYGAHEGFSLKRADEVQIGDQVSMRKENGTHYASVTHISSDLAQGLHVPLTPSGDLVVNGVFVSSYISIKGYAPDLFDHPLWSWWLSERILIHLWLSPYRMYCMGVRPNYCQPDSDGGIPTWPLLGFAMSRFANDQHVVVQILMGFLFFVILGTFYAIESFVGSSRAPAFLATILVLFYFKKIYPTNNVKSV